MTVEIHEDRIILKPYTEHEKQALARLIGKVVTVESCDSWNYGETGVVIKTQKDDWGT